MNFWGNIRIFSTEAESPRENAADYETGPASMAVGTGTGNLGTNPTIMPDPDIRVGISTLILISLKITN